MDDAPDEDRPAETPPVDDGPRHGPAADDEPMDDDEPMGDGPATDDDGNVFGPRPDEPRVGPILPGDPDLENVAFVLLGVATSLVLIADLVGLL
jgi:hypothetical protein